MKKTMLQDNRVIHQDKVQEYEVFTFTKEERETNLNYLEDEKVWRVQTNIQPHITKLLKLNNIEYEIICVNENGTITYLLAYLQPKQVSFRNMINREITEEQREKASQRLKEYHNNKNK